MLPDAERNQKAVSAPQVYGWRFRGSYTEEGCRAATAALSDHEDAPRLLPTLWEEGPVAAYRLLHRLLRNCWGNVGIDSGMRVDRIITGDKQPVAAWLDEEVAAALRTWQKLRRIMKPSQETEF